MAAKASSGYRSRIYGAYVTARNSPLAPESLHELLPRVPYFRRMIRVCFPRDPGISVFDLGCGHGLLLYLLREAGFRNVRGVDSSPEQVATAHRLGIGGVSQEEAVDALRRTTDASEDVVIAFDLIEHLTKPELLDLVDQVRRVLRPGGRWVIHTPNGESPFVGRVRYGDFTHELAFTRESLAQLLLSSGFSEVLCFEDRPVIHGLRSAIRAALWRVIRGALLVALAAETGALDRRAVLSQNLLAVAVRGD